MNTAQNNSFSIIGLAAACSITLTLGGTMLMGFDQLAHAAPTATPDTQLVKVDASAKQITLERVVITARRA